MEIYGFLWRPDPTQRYNSWELHKRLQGTLSLPWLVGGDFNEILFNSEKRGGPDNSASVMLDFQETLSTCRLRDLGWTGNKYTWSNRREPNFLVEERLDRYVASLESEYLFTGARVSNITTVGSDHSPIIVDVIRLSQVSKNVKWGKQFHFEEFWTEHPDCRDEIVNAWQGNVAFGTKVHCCRENLKKWSKRKFGQEKPKLEELHCMLENLNSGPKTDATVP